MSVENRLQKILWVSNRPDKWWLSTLAGRLSQFGLEVEPIGQDRLTRMLKRAPNGSVGVVIDSTSVQYPYRFVPLALRWLPRTAIWVAGSVPSEIGMVDATQAGVFYLQKTTDIRDLANALVNSIQQINLL